MQKKKKGLWLSAVLLLSTFPVAVHAQEADNGPRAKSEVRQEIEQALQQQVEEQVQEYESLTSNEAKKEYIQEFGEAQQSVYSIQSTTEESPPSETEAKEIFEETLADAYVYTMDENGYVYDREGEVANRVDVSQTANDDASAPAESRSFAVQAAAANTINGAASGAFARQETSAGYRSISTTLTLPTEANISVPNDSIVAYLYTGIDVKPTSSTTNGGYKVEAGLQYSPVTKSYTASIHPQNSAQNAIPTGPSEYAGQLPPRYKAGTSIVGNLKYDPDSSQFKYFVNGTNVSGQPQYIYFYYSKALDSSQLADMHVKRVTALATDNYTDQNIGRVKVQYTDTTITNTSGTTVALTSAKLDTITSGNRVYGTADSPSQYVTKSPDAFSIASQLITVDTTK